MIIHKCNRVTLWRKRKRFGTKAACPPFPFIPDTHSRMLCSLSEKPKQSKSGQDLANVSSWFSLFWSARQEGTGDWGTVSSRNSLLSELVRWSFSSPPHPQSAGQVGERWWRRHQLKALALQLSRGLHLIFFLFVCFFNKTFIDFLVEGIWGSVLQKSRGCLSHLKIQHLAHVARWQGCCRGSLQGSGNCFWGFSFLQTQADTGRKLLLPKPPVLRRGEACRTLGRMSHAESLHSECLIQHTP